MKKAGVAAAKSGRGWGRSDVFGDLVESAFRTGNDFVGSKAFKDFGELVEITANDDVGVFVAIARAFGDEQGGLDIVRGDDDGGGALDAGAEKGALLFGVIHDHGFTGAHEVFNNQGIAVDKHVGPGVAAKVVDDTLAEVAVANNDDVIFQLTGEHAAALLRVVALNGLKEEKRNDDAEEDALSPEGVELPERTGMYPQVKCGKKSFA